MIIGWDFETHLIKDGMVAPRPVCMSQFIDAIGCEDPAELYLRSQARAVLEGHLSDKLTTLIGHNTAYDLVCAMAEWPELARLIFDAVDDGRARCTFIRQCLLDVAAGESEFRRRVVVDGSGQPEYKATRAGRALDDLVLLYFNEVLSKEDRIRMGFGKLDGLPLSEWPKDAVDYVLKDAAEPVRVFHAQAENARVLAARPDMEGVWVNEGTEDIPDERPQTRAALWLQLMSAWGLRTDPVAVHKLRAEHEASQAEIKRRLEPTGIIRADGSRDMKVIQARVVAAYSVLENLEPPRTPKGAVKTDTETLVESGDPDLALLGDSLSDASTVGTWLPWLELGTKTPICVGYNPIVDSGRTSARKPNIQNPPRKGDIRACFKARDGYLYSFCDYDTAELRALAQVCIWLVGWSDLGDALRAGLDPHLALAADLLGITYEEALARYEAGDPEVAEMRQLCKVANFGYPGGLGPEKFVLYAHGYDARLKALVDLPRSRQLRDAWFRRWREMRKFFAAVSAAVGDDGHGAIQQFGSRRVRGGCNFTAGANTCFQGLIADGGKRAGWDLARECYLGDWRYPPEGDEEIWLHKKGRPSPLLGSRPIMFVHDEFGAEIPSLDLRAASLASDRQARVQRLAMQSIIPDVPIKCSSVLMKRWYKGARGLRINGLLVPVRPEQQGGKTAWVHDEQ